MTGDLGRRCPSSARNVYPEICLGTGANSSDGETREISLDWPAIPRYAIKRVPLEERANVGVQCCINRTGVMWTSHEG
jgi:hypothetical protein